MPKRLNIKQRIIKTWASKSSRFAFGRKALPPAGLAFLQTIMTITALHLGNQDNNKTKNQRHRTLIASAAKARVLIRFGVFKSDDLSATVSRFSLVTAEAAILLALLLKKAGSSCFRRLSVAGKESTPTVSTVLGLQGICSKFREWCDLLIRLAEPFSRARTLDKLRLLADDYCRVDFWCVLARNGDYLKSLSANWKTVVQSHLDKKCKTSGCSELRVAAQPPDFDGSVHCTHHHRQLVSSAERWFFADSVEIGIPSFRNFCNEHSLSNVFLCYQECLAYGDTKDRNARLKKGLGVVRTYLQAKVPLSVVSSDPDPEEQLILQGIIVQIKKPRFSTGLFKPLSGRMLVFMEKAFAIFQASAVYSKHRSSIILPPALRAPTPDSLSLRLHRPVFDTNISNSANGSMQAGAASSSAAAAAAESAAAAPRRVYFPAELVTGILENIDSDDEKEDAVTRSAPSSPRRRNSISISMDLVAATENVPRHNTQEDQLHEPLSHFDHHLGASPHPRSATFDGMNWKLVARARTEGLSVVPIGGTPRPKPTTITKAHSETRLLVPPPSATPRTSY